MASGVVAKEWKNVPAFWKHVRSFNTLTKRVLQRCVLSLSVHLLLCFFLTVLGKYQVGEEKSKGKTHPPWSEQHYTVCLQPDVSDGEPVSIQ